jgi:hypothetical protein
MPPPLVYCLFTCTLVYFLRGFDDSPTAETRGRVGVVPLDLVGDEPCTTAAALSQQAAASFGHLGDTLPHFVKR